MGNCFRKIMSHVLSVSERFSVYISFISIVTCAVLCMMCMLAFGIGLGYNYSYVDYRAKHTYVKAGYTKARPTNFYGPGYFKPTTSIPKYSKYWDWEKSWENLRKQVPPLLKPNVTYEILREPPHDLPHYSPVEMIKGEHAPEVKPEVEKVHTRLEGLYFSKITTKPRLLTVSLDPQNDSTTEMTTEVSSDTKAYMYDRKEEEGNAFQESDVNATQYLSEPEESVTVNVTKTHNDTAPPFIIKTMMHPNHLSKWLTRLRRANKTFAVHVITD